MKAKFIKSASGSPYYLGYHIGEIGDLPEKLYNKLLDGGFVEPVKEPQKAKADTEKSTSKKQQSSAKTNK